MPPIAPELEKTQQIFRFLKAFAEKSTPIKRTLGDQLWNMRLAEFPVHPAIQVGEVTVGGDGAAEDADSQDNKPLIRVQRPRLTDAPKPGERILEWLKPSWRKADGTLEVIEARNVRQGNETITEAFGADAQRAADFESYKLRWDAWSKAELPAIHAERVFERFYELRGRIERESEQVELLLADGRLRWNSPDGRIDHPVLLQRVELEFDALVPEFRVIDAERGPELYTALLSADQGLSAGQLNELRVELEQAGFHPLARAATSGYLRRLVQTLGARGQFFEVFEDHAHSADPIVTRDPVLILRVRNSGYAAAFDRILEDLEANGTVPNALVRLVGIEPPAPSERVQPNNSPWGEPADVLLSKPANQEQILIARALQNHTAVLVQGPPGTGKSHTIANLIGHLVAHGKRVLVTSHTTKALKVLRGHIVDSLKPLCVSVLDQDLEGRIQMEAAVRGILSRLTQSTEPELANSVVNLTEQRSHLNREIDGITSDLLAARQAEYLPIVVDNVSENPIPAARWVRGQEAANSWIPGPVSVGAPLPLSENELNELYATNTRLTRDEEGEIADTLPAVDDVVVPRSFEALLLEARQRGSDGYNDYWEREAVEEEIDSLDALAAATSEAVERLNRFHPWQRTVASAGYLGGAEEQIWTDLKQQVFNAGQTWERTRPILLQREVEVIGSLGDDAVRCVDDIIKHIDGGGNVTGLAMLFRAEWKALIAALKVNGKSPESAGDFRAVRAYLVLEDGRRRLAQRWARQAEPAKLPPYASFSSPPEQILREYADQFDDLLLWWRAAWSKIESSASAAGFRWREFRQNEVARSEPAFPFDRDALILSGALKEAVESRVSRARSRRALRKLAELDLFLAAYTGPVCSALRNAVQTANFDSYATAWDSLQALNAKKDIWAKRTELLKRVEAAAPKWAQAIRTRLDIHGMASVPGDPPTAWRWRCLSQEIERRAGLDEVALTKKLDQRREALRQTTAELIDQRAWLGQMRRTDLNARQALQGWADTQRKIGRGTGRRAPALQADARKLLSKAKDAVPVWIMPLSRVAESFDVRGRFDVVIVDEASQSDVTGLLAWYLGDQIAIVGDHEQVSPMAVGQKIDVMTALIAQHLQGVPNSHLYDGSTSVYDLARQSFGGTIALREHFRCVPDIIEFSNELSYNFEIRPLRNGSAVQRPHVVEYVVQPELGSIRSGKTNIAEARVIVALVKAATEMPEYDGKTMGAITLLADEQAGLIQDLVVSVVDPVELERRRFGAGNSAQFQGDERDIMFLSMVDTPTGNRLPMKQADAFKQRYNVAVSRARDQLWLIHSLSLERDLQPGDLRHRLIEYVRDPGARRRMQQQAERRAESPFEKEVLNRLIAAGYHVEPQVWVGRYRLDMVVSDGTRQIALECDGDRFHGLDQIPGDMARQAILERAGWRFIRIRGTRFYRNPETSFEWITSELTRLNIHPSSLERGQRPIDETAQQFRDKMRRRAWQIMEELGWTPAEPEDLSRVELVDSQVFPQ